MKVRVVLILMVLGVLSCTDDDRIKGSGSIVQQDRELADFSQIRNTGAVEVTISKSSSKAVRIFADDNVINNVRTTVSNGVLTIDLAPGSYDNITVEAGIRIPTFSGLQNTGSGTMEILGFLGMETLEIRNEGSGTMAANGSGNTLIIQNTGSGTFKGYGFGVNTCTVTNSGSGNCEIFCIDALGGTNTGSGTIFYKGTPAVSITNTGSGQVVDAN